MSPYNTLRGYMMGDKIKGMKCDFSCKTLGIEGQQKWHDKQSCSVMCEQKYRLSSNKKDRATSRLRLLPDETFEIHKE